MTDRELLEFAAKAAGIKGEWDDAYHGIVTVRASDGRAFCVWNALSDDGSALRLAVKLRLDVFNYGPPIHDEAHVDVVHMDGRKYGGSTEDLGSDPYAATRRAIVRAAAEIGKTMP